MAIFVRCIDNTLAADVLVVGEIYEVMHDAVRPDPAFTDVAAFLASWRPLYSIYRDFHQIGDEEVIAT